ncbi:MAG TPA: dual specificity protein phosphatase [Ktedonobacteraceae bacterium]|nr:dual specificity protein phosphatase [Ktedonobacteraceae bacterium]
MIEVYPGLFVGSRMDYETIVSGQDGWAIVHACRSYHRMTVGYRVLSVAKGHPDYLVAQRENRLMLCLLDLPVAVPIEREMIERTLDFIDRMRAGGRKVLVHCVQGRSRSPSITLLYMAARLHALPGDSLEAAEARFRQVYPLYQPNRGIREHLRRHWREYCKNGEKWE